jgi:hypothetical protein
MRNILQYPMTHEEAIDILTRFKNDCDSELVGDIRPYAIDWVIDKLKEQQNS